MAKPIPEGFRTLTPYIRVAGAAKAIEFYKKAFAAEETERMTWPGSDRIMHAELKIGDSMLMLSDEFKERNALSPQSLGGTASSIHMYVADVDAAFKRAVDAGAKVKMPLMDMFWGDRYGQLQDPFGHEWSIATHKEDVPPDQIPQRAAEQFKKMGHTG